MSKNKILTIILVVLLVITAIVLFIYFYPKIKFSYSFTKDFLSQSDLSECKNYHQKIEFYSGDANELIGYYDIYKKDHLTYTYQLDISTQESSELYQDDINNSLITVINPRKRIIATTIPMYTAKNTDAFFEKAKQNETNENLGVYKYLGTESFNGLDCLKVSLTDNYDSYQDVDIYYIDLNTGFIVKNEYYTSKDSDSLVKMHTEINIFEFDIVKDEDVKKFTMDNYPEYDYRD